MLSFLFFFFCASSDLQNHILLYSTAYTYDNFNTWFGTVTVGGKFENYICRLHGPQVYKYPIFSKKELNLTHFYTNPNFLLALWKDLTELNPRQCWSFEKVLFGKVMGEQIILALRTQYMATWLYGQKHKIMMSSKCVFTFHPMRRFLQKSLALKIHPNAGQMPGTGAKRKKKNMANSVRGRFDCWYLWRLYIGE